MEHDELLANIDKRARFINADDVYKGCRAVVELHKPFANEYLLYCQACGDIYPCPTIKVIYKELS